MTNGATINGSYGEIDAIQTSKFLSIKMNKTSLDYNIMKMLNNLNTIQM